MEAPFYYYILLVLLLRLLLNPLLQIKNSRRLPPSPALSLPLLGHLHLLKKPLHRTLAELSARHGPVLLLNFGSRPVLVVSSPFAAEECFTKNDITFANRPRLSAGKHFGCNYTSLLWAPYGHHWRNLRRIATLEILSPGRIQMYSGVRTEEVKSLIRRLCKGSDAAGFRVVDMKRMFFELTLNVMMRMIAGKRYCGENGSEVEEARKFRDMVMQSFQLSGATNMADFVPILRWVGLNGMEKRAAKLQGSRDQFMQNLIEEHRRIRRRDSSAPEKSCRVMIDVLLDLQEKEPEYYTDNLIRCIMLGMVSAGTDTSSGTMEWALSLLLNNPDSLFKAHAEIDSHLPPNTILQESHLPHLPYLHCIIKETLRRYPAAPLLVPHESSEDCTVAGFHVPRGTILLVNNWAIQNDPEFWVEPMKFKPERFEGSGGETDGWRWLPFGAGRRGCAGEGLAMRLVGLSLGSLIQCFEWERVGEEMGEMSEGGGLTMPKAQPLFAKCRPRPVLANLLPLL